MTQTPKEIQDDVPETPNDEPTPAEESPEAVQEAPVEESPVEEAEAEPIEMEASLDMSEAEEAIAVEEEEAAEIAAEESEDAGEEAVEENVIEAGEEASEEETSGKVIHIELNGRTVVVAAAFAAGAGVYVGGKLASKAFGLASLIADGVASKADELTGNRISRLTKGAADVAGGVAGKVLGVLGRGGADDDDNWDSEDWGDDDWDDDEF